MEDVQEISNACIGRERQEIECAERHCFVLAGHLSDTDALLFRLSLVLDH